MPRLDEAHVVITGGAGGIGAACVKAFQNAGAQIRILDKDFSKLDADISIASDVSCHVLDITDEASVDAHFAEFGAADIIINCAGIVPQGSIAQCSASEFRRTLDINVTGAFLVARAGVRAALEASRPLSIVAISSVISSIASAPNRLAYATSKAALIGMTKSVALDFIKDDIRSNVICPGTVDTASLRSRIDVGGLSESPSEDDLALFHNRQPIGRMGTAEEIAELVLFVAGGQTRFMTGSVITVDGGFAL